MDLFKNIEFDTKAFNCNGRVSIDTRDVVLLMDESVYSKLKELLGNPEVEESSSFEMKEYKKIFEIEIKGEKVLFNKLYMC